MEGPDDVLALMDTGAEGVVALVRDAGRDVPRADLPRAHRRSSARAARVRSHIGIVSREFQVPCVMGCAFAGDEPAAGTEVELDCSGDEAVVRG